MLISSDLRPGAEGRARAVRIVGEASPQLRFGMSIGGRWAANSGPVVALPLSALFEQNGTPAVWVVDERTGNVALRPVVVALTTTPRQ